MSKLSKPVRLVIWAIANGLKWLLTYYAIVEGVNGAENVVKFWIWMGFVLAIFALAKPVAEAMRKDGASVPLWLNTILDLAYAGFIIWHGWLWTGIAFVVSFFITTAIYAEKKDGV